ncbi:MAG: 30S ribosomal protein S9 [Candidatus Caenarcaniphilales bacterium]|nr:30S ribosomal protein S9 [Candidatus Caenarcaniphilales bacterium]
MPATQYNATGRRKRSIARVFISPGKGKFTVNGKDLKVYFCERAFWIERIMEPLARTTNLEKFDVLVNANGGGINGQADAIRLGLARALVEYDASYHGILKAIGLLTRDAREVERKHYYKHKARKSPQYSKR